jgi:hypothetical protein
VLVNRSRDSELSARAAPTGDPNKPPVATDPHYLKMRASNVVGGREIEFALFARALDEHDCANGTPAGWEFPRPT